MRSRRKAAVVALVAALAAGVPAWAQDARSPVRAPITLDEALTQALARNRDLAVSRRNIDISQGQLRQARRYPFNPELNVGGQVGQGLGRDVAPPDRRSLGGGSIGLSQVVEIKGQRGLRVRAAESDLVRTEWDVRNTEREVVAETTRAFSELLLAQEQVVLARQALDLTTGLRNTARGLVQAGAVPEVDALRAEVEVRRATNRVTLGAAAVSRASRALALLIGAPPEDALHASGPLLLEPLPSDLEALRRAARENRPDVKAAEAAIKSARAALELVRAERFFPALILSAGYAEALDFDSTNRLALFGISIPLPIWNPRDGELQAAGAEVRKRETDLGRILAGIDKEVATAFDQFAAARTVVEEYVKQIVPGQEQSVAIVQDGYALGQFRITDALLAQRDLIDTRTGYLEAIAAYNAARVELERAVGARQAQ